MTRVAIILIIVSVFCGALYFGFQILSRSAQFNSSGEAQRIVCASKEIEKGDTFEASNLQCLPPRWDREPQPSFDRPDPILDRRSSRHINAGEVIGFEDVLVDDRSKWTKDDAFRNRRMRDRPRPKGFFTVLYLIGDVPSGEIVPTYLVESKEVASKYLPPDAVNLLEDVRGKKAKSRLVQGQIIRAVDLQ